MINHKRFQHNSEFRHLNISFQKNAKNSSNFGDMVKQMVCNKSQDFSETSRGKIGMILSAMCNVNCQVKLASKTANELRTKEIKFSQNHFYQSLSHPFFAFLFIYNIGIPLALEEQRGLLVFAF